MGSDIMDDALFYVNQMSSLRELYLQQTQIEGIGLAYLFPEKSALTGSFQNLDYRWTIVT